MQWCMKQNALHLQYKRVYNDRTLNDWQWYLILQWSKAIMKDRVGNWAADGMSYAMLSAFNTRGHKMIAHWMDHNDIRHWSARENWSQSMNWSMGALVFKWLSISQNGAEIKSGMAIASHTTCLFSTNAGERNNLLSTRSCTMMVLKLQRSMLLKAKLCTRGFFWKTAQPWPRFRSAIRSENKWYYTWGLQQFVHSIHVCLFNVMGFWTTHSIICCLTVCCIGKYFYIWTARGGFSICDQWTICWGCRCHGLEFGRGDCGFVLWVLVKTTWKAYTRQRFNPTRYLPHIVFTLVIYIRLRSNCWKWYTRSCWWWTNWWRSY